jgi:hypothetical protein
MRVIARRERPHPGAQLRLTDEDGWRITCFAANTKGTGWTLPLLEVRHRQRARAEDRIRNLKDTGLRNLPFHGFAQNQIWLEIIALAPISSLGPRTWPGTASQPDAGNPKDSAFGCWPWPDASSAAVDAVDSGSHATGPGTTIDTDWAALQPD